MASSTYKSLLCLQLLSQEKIIKKVMVFPGVHLYHNLDWQVPVQLWACVCEGDVEATLVMRGHVYVVLWSVCLNQKLELFSNLPAAGKISNINCMELAMPGSHFSCSPGSAEKVKESGKDKKKKQLLFFFFFSICRLCFC